MACPKDGYLLSTYIVHRHCTFRDVGTGRNIWTSPGGDDIPLSMVRPSGWQNNTRWACGKAMDAENINLALDVAPKVKAGRCGSTAPTSLTQHPVSAAIANQDSGVKAVREGLYEYLKPKSEALLSSIAPKTSKVQKKSGKHLACH